MFAKTNEHMQLKTELRWLQKLY